MVTFKKVSPIKLNPINLQPAARVAKLVDALSSGGSIRKVVLVRIQSRAQRPWHDSAGVFLARPAIECLLSKEFSERPKQSHKCHSRRGDLVRPIILGSPQLIQPACRSFILRYLLLIESLHKYFYLNFSLHIGLLLVSVFKNADNGITLQIPEGLLSETCKKYPQRIL